MSISVLSYYFFKEFKMLHWNNVHWIVVILLLTCSNFLNLAPHSSCTFLPTRLSFMLCHCLCFPLLCQLSVYAYSIASCVLNIFPEECILYAMSHIPLPFSYFYYLFLIISIYMEIAITYEIIVLFVLQALIISGFHFLWQRDNGHLQFQMTFCWLKWGYFYPQETLIVLKKKKKKTGYI